MKLQRFLIQDMEISLTDFCENVLHFATDFERFCLLDSQDFSNDIHATGPHRYRLLAGLGEVAAFELHENNLEDLDFFFNELGNNWYFGHLNYDLKNVMEPRLTSNKKDPIGFPLLRFFMPEIIIAVRDQDILLISNCTAAPKEVYMQLTSITAAEKNARKKGPSKLGSQLHYPDKITYINTINSIHKELLNGTIYELNYCIPITAEQVVLNPVTCSKNLRLASPAPFSCLYRYDEKWLLCSSPERWIRKEENKILSQPIKGTAPRSADPEEDQLLSDNLSKDEKERAENMMIVDLVRNDLSKIAASGTVKVDELCGIYHFPKVHQMISTVSAELPENTSFTDIVKALFPMGSMTGAPKISAMELIEKHESFRRGLFSGSVGYIAPDGDFDFNVVIRSILLNTETKNILIPAGSAITAKSNPEAEYNECLLKAAAMLKVLGVSIDQKPTI